MALLMILTKDQFYDPLHWRRQLQRLLPEFDVRIWPDVGKSEDIVMVLADHIPRGALNNLPSLRCILYSGLGPDSLIRNEECRHIPIARLVDPLIVNQLVEYVLLQVLRFHRHAHDYDRFQREHVWRVVRGKLASETNIAVLGMGVVGRPVAEALAWLGFVVTGWTRTPKEIPKVCIQTGADAFPRVLQDADFVIATLPSTRETQNLMNRDAFAAMKAGSYLINIGRGDLIVENALIEALDSGRLSGAALDVHRTTPLPTDHPFWSHPRIVVTPHAAGVLCDTSIPKVAEIYRNVARGDLPSEIVDLARGY
jgi:glyoxylate/hydroxypyruvate reductase A